MSGPVEIPADLATRLREFLAERPASPWVSAQAKQPGGRMEVLVDTPTGPVVAARYYLPGGDDFWMALSFDHDAKTFRATEVVNVRRWMRIPEGGYQSPPEPPLWYRPESEATKALMARALGRKPEPDSHDWVRVGDRLPHENRQVLVFAPGYYGMARHHEVAGWGTDGGRPIDGVSHWREPPPEPSPKG